MILRLKAYFNVLKWDIYYSSKERPYLSFKDTVDLIRVKITLMRCLIFIVMQDSVEYRFIDDGVS